MKKILLSAYACSPIRGSEESNGWQWVTGLSQRGYEVWCLTNIEDKAEILRSQKDLNLVNVHFVFVQLIANLDDALLHPSTKKIYFHYYLWQKRASSIAKALHNTHSFDIAHHVTYGSLQQGTFLWRLKKIKLLFGPVGGGQKSLLFFKGYFGSDWKTEQIRSFISSISFKVNRNLKNTLRLASHIMVTNHDTENLIKESNYYNINKLHLVLDNAVTPSLLKVAPKIIIEHKELHLLWVGRILPRKGLNLVLEGLARVSPDIPYTLTIVGGDTNFLLIPGWIKQYKLDPTRITIVGKIPYSQVIDYYLASDAFIFCSLRDSCPTQLSEAMAFGLPIITLDMHGAAIAVPDNCGIKIKPTSLEATLNGIADAVKEMYTNKPLRDLYTINGQKHTQLNTWKAKIDHVTKNYYEI